MRELRYTLVTDGPSDDALIPLLSWLLVERGVIHPIAPQWADFQRLPRPPKTLAERIRHALDLYPCDILFIHRDAEAQRPEQRRGEIHEALSRISETTPPPVICVVPVRMTEAWLLFDVRALRRAAGNPNGKTPLDMPPVADLEKVPNPKAILYALLKAASGLNGRRLKKFSTIGSARRVAGLLDDFGPLRALPAFCSLESDLAEIVGEFRWDRV